MTLRAAMQNYLAETYRLAHYQEDSPYVSTSALAQEMGVSAPAVTRMVQRLKDAGYLKHEPYQGIMLTPEGERAALSNIRRHRLVERFLVDVMQFGWHEVHDAADRLGIAVSDKLVDRMEAMTGNPRRCPHGEPIPTREGKMPPVRDYPLNTVEPGTPLVLSRVHTHDDEKLRYLTTLGLLPGTKFDLLERAPFNGPLRLGIDGETHFIGYELAGVLRVCAENEFELDAV